MTEAVDELSTVNFRSRVAQQKRERMRHRLLQALMYLRAEARGANPVVVDDVVQKADVSRGTFYKYFNSIDEALEELGKDITEDLVQNMTDFLGEEADLAKRICIGTCALLVRASVDPVWGGVVSQAEHVSTTSLLLEAMQTGCQEGRADGLFEFDRLDVAVDFHAGFTFQGMRRMAQSPFDKDYVLGVAALILSGLGVGRGEARSIAQAAWDELLVIAPGRLNWWPDHFEGLK